LNQGKAGTRFVFQGFPAVATNNGSLSLVEVQPAGKKWMSGKDFLNGNPNWAELKND
jgi:methionyl-tRNA formyltransferase